MAGHSKWKKIKRAKDVTDSKRGQLFTKVTREITVAARQGGPDPGFNVRLRLAIQKAKEANMPQDNVERAIKRGAGVGADGAPIQFEEITYEGYGPGGAAILLQVVTDNRNRAAGDVRRVFTKGGGHLGQVGSVAWSFEQRGVISVEGTDATKLEDVALAAIDAGAEDFRLDGDLLELYSDPKQFDAIRHAVEGMGAKVMSAELSMVPKSTVTLSSKDASTTLRLLDSLEELEDVQKVYTNADFPDEVLEQYRSVA